MIVTCPNCKTQYRVDFDLIPDEGRRVRCRTCRHAWRQLPVAEPEPEPEPLPPVVTRVPKVAPRPPPPMPADEADDPFFASPKAGAGSIAGPGPGLGFGADLDMSLGTRAEPSLGLGLGSAIEEDPFESRLARRRSQASGDNLPMSMRNRTEPKASTPLWVWAALLALLAGLGGGGYAFVQYRDAIAMAVPQTASIYSKLAEITGMPELVVNVRGLTFRGVDHTRGYEGTEPYLSVTGAVVNMTDEELPVGPIRIAFHDESKHLLEVRLVRPQAEKIGPHLSTKFGVRLTKVPEKMAFVEVAFARPEDIPKDGLPPLPEKPAESAPTAETPMDGAAATEPGTAASEPHAPAPDMAPAHESPPAKPH